VRVNEVGKNFAQWREVFNHHSLATAILGELLSGCGPASAASALIAVAPCAFEPRTILQRPQ
jgi:hypothetical protein